MKATVCYQPHCLPRRPIAFPGGVSRRQFFGRLLDLLLITASGIGVSAMVVFLLVLF